WLKMFGQSDGPFTGIHYFPFRSMPSEGGLPTQFVPSFCANASLWVKDWEFVVLCDGLLVNGRSLCDLVSLNQKSSTFEKTFKTGPVRGCFRVQISTWIQFFRFAEVRDGTVNVTGVRQLVTLVHQLGCRPPLSL